MTIKSLILYLWLSLSLAFLQPGLCCAASPTEMSTEDLMILEDSLNTSEAALMSSLQELETARELLMASEQELTDLELALDESETALAELKVEQAKLKTQLARLSAELALLKSKSTMLSADLKKAEQSLNDTEAKYKAERKKEKRQTRLWQVISVVLAGVAATR